MLTEEERREIEAELHQYAQKRAVCIDALKIVQRRRGWVSDESVRDLAEFLEMTPDELDSVATFYNLILWRDRLPKTFGLTESRRASRNTNGRAATDPCAEPCGTYRRRR